MLLLRLSHHADAPAGSGPPGIVMRHSVSRDCFPNSDIIHRFARA